LLVGGALLSQLTGAVHAFYLFDVAQAIDLAALERLLGPQAASATLTDKSAGPPRVRYFVPPIVVDGAVLGAGTIDGFTVRVKAYDYGVLSFMLSRPFTAHGTRWRRWGRSSLKANRSKSRRPTPARRWSIAFVRRSPASGRRF
jgi:hypothetical protein